METVAEVHQTISTVRPTSTHGVSCVLNVLNSTVRMILRSVFKHVSVSIQASQDVGRGRESITLRFCKKEIPYRLCGR